jgi:polyphosphate:AMP phosphotransferase
MFEAAEIGAKVSKQEYEAALPQLRTDLINAQFDLARADFPVLLLLAGDDRIGCNEILNILHEWMDARYLQTHVFQAESREESDQPRFFRLWQALPAKGELAIFAGSWVSELIAWRLTGEIGDRRFDALCRHAHRFENLLIDDGALVVKLWIHLPKKKLERRVKKAARREGRRSWQIEDADRRILEHYDDAMPWIERFLRLTDSPAAPWTVVEGSDDRHRNLTVARELLARLSGRLAARPDPPPDPPPAPPPARRTGARLDAVDLERSLDYERYRERLDRLQGRLHRLVDRARGRGVTSVVVLEGWDAAGKGGVIRRMTAALDVGEYHVVPISAPSPEERAHHYLWRFWRRLPPPGEMVIFDRSWYGRVLVERVEGYASEAEWRRAYAEIEDFEENLVEHGFVLAKFWLHIDRDEQLRRFGERAQTTYKKYKIGDEDFRNRRRWDDYRAAVEEMLERTDTRVAPWRLIPANDKRFARVTLLDAVCDDLERRLSKGRRWRKRSA